MILNKAKMAHDYAIEMLKRGDPERSIAFDAWTLADTMQAEADKREEQKDIANSESSKVFFEKLTDSRSLTKDENGNCLHFHHEFGHKKCMDCGASLEEWQPDWSQAPDWANWWCLSVMHGAMWFSREPICTKATWAMLNDVKFCAASFDEAPSFNYAGNWQDSLRKRPQ